MSTISKKMSYNKFVRDKTELDDDLMECSYCKKAKIIAFVIVMMLPVSGGAQRRSGGESNEGGDAMAAEAFQAGQALYKNGEYLEAVHQFEKAYRLAPHPSVLANIGYCYNKIGDYPKAVKALREYLESPSPREKKRNKRIVKYIEEMKSKVGDLRVSCPAARCEVAVDNRAYGMTPTAILLRAGVYSVEVTPIDGGEKRRFNVNVPGGGEFVLDVDVSSLHQDPALEVGERVSPDVTLGSEQTSQAQGSVVSTQTMKTMKTLAWVGLGSTVVLGATSGVLFYYRGKAIDAFDKEDQLYLNASAAESPKHKTRRDKAGTRAELLHGFAIATAVTAGVCAIGALTAGIIAASKRKKKSNSKAEIQAGVFSFGVTF